MTSFAASGVTRAEGEGEELLLRFGDRWVTVRSADDYLTSRYRHIVAKGKPTSACGTTALPVAMWRGNSTKPKCPQCIAAARRPAHQRLNVHRPDVDPDGAR